MCAAQINHLALRRVAQTGISAALPAHFDLAAGTRRDQDVDLIAIDLAGTKKLVIVLLTLGQGGGMRGVQTVKLEAFLIQIVVVGNLPAQPGFARWQRFAAEGERLGHRQKVDFLGKRIITGLRLAEARQQ